MNEINKHNRICVYTKQNNVYHIAVHKKFVAPKKQEESCVIKALLTAIEEVLK